MHISLGRVSLLVRTECDSVISRTMDKFLPSPNKMPMITQSAAEVNCWIKSLPSNEKRLNDWTGCFSWNTFDVIYHKRVINEVSRCFCKRFIHNNSKLNILELTNSAPPNRQIIPNAFGMEIMAHLVFSSHFPAPGPGSPWKIWKIVFCFRQTFRIFYVEFRFFFLSL